MTHSPKSRVIRFLRRRRGRRYWLRLAVIEVFAALLVNVLVQDGLKPFLILLAVVVAALALAAIVFGATGYQVVVHAQRERQAIKSGTHPKRMELER